MFSRFLHTIAFYITILYQYSEIKVEFIKLKSYWRQKVDDVMNMLL